MPELVGPRPAVGGGPLRTARGLKGSEAPAVTLAGGELFLSLESSGLRSGVKTLLTCFPPSLSHLWFLFPEPILLRLGLGRAVCVPCFSHN